jgi:hypothetical protein
MIQKCHMPNSNSFLLSQSNGQLNADFTFPLLCFYTSYEILRLNRLYVFWNLCHYTLLSNNVSPPHMFVDSPCSSLPRGVRFIATTFVI